MRRDGLVNLIFGYSRFPDHHTPSFSPTGCNAFACYSCGIDFEIAVGHFQSKMERIQHTFQTTFNMPS